jgi:hypothetical protein
MCSSVAYDIQKWNFITCLYCSDIKVCFEDCKGKENSVIEDKIQKRKLVCNETGYSSIDNSLS